MSTPFNIIEQTRKLLFEAKDFILGSPWRGELTSDIESMLQNVDKECELAIFGTVKAGKSTFINTILGEDLAVVDVTEATATINYFKYAKNQEDDGRVLVVYTDGCSEWKDKDFLDSLQGNTEEVLKRAEGIDHLEFFVNNNILRHITIVDTPGTHSVVDQHSSRTNLYSSSAQAERNAKESIRLKNKADAVIVLLGHVKTVKDKENVQEFTDSCIPYNTLGVISKIDKTEDFSYEDWLMRCKDIQTEFSHRLHSTHPVSPMLYRVINEIKESECLKKIHFLLNSISQEKLASLGLTHEILIGLIAEDEKSTQSNIDVVRYSERDEIALSDMGLDHHTRLSIVKLLPIPTVRTIILVNLLNRTYKDAIDKIISISGFETVSNILQQQFFNRSHAIRCHSILRKLLSILRDMQLRRIPDLKRHAVNLKHYLLIIDSFDKMVGSYTSENQRIIQSLRSIVLDNVVHPDTIDKLSSSISMLIDMSEDIITALEGVNDNSEGLLLLEKNRTLLTNDLILELELLFGKYPERANELLANYSIAERLPYWKSRAERVRNENLKRICLLAENAWAQMNV